MSEYEHYMASRGKVVPTPAAALAAEASPGEAFESEYERYMERRRAEAQANGLRDEFSQWRSSEEIQRQHAGTA